MKEKKTGLKSSSEKKAVSKLLTLEFLVVRTLELRLMRLRCFHLMWYYYCCRCCYIVIVKIYISIHKN